MLPAGFIAPCNPTVSERPPSGPNWIHEIKHDGCRLIVRRDGGRARFDKLHSQVHNEHVFLYAFDLMELHSEDYRSQPLEKRKAKLEKLLARTEGMRFVEHLGVMVR
jgi:bifunctional non-homologous end joining protein LigD